MMKKRFVGVDLGSAYIKVATAEVKGRRLCGLSLKQAAITSDKDEDLVSILKELIPEQRAQVFTSVGDGQVFSHIVQFPPLKKREVEAAAKHEIERVFPSLEGAIVRYLPLGAVQREKAQEFLLLAVQEELIYRRYDIFSQVGVVLSAIDLSAFALCRLFGEATQDCRMIVDLGAKFITIIILKDGELRLLKTISIKGLLPLGGSDPMGNYAVLDGIAGEIHRLAVLCSHQEGFSPDKLILTGGNGKAEDIRYHLQNLFEVSIDNQGVVIPELNQREIDPSFSVAVGLALKEVSR